MKDKQVRQTKTEDQGFDSWEDCDKYFSSNYEDMYQERHLEIIADTDGWKSDGQ